MLRILFLLCLFCYMAKFGFFEGTGRFVFAIFKLIAGAIIIFFCLALLYSVFSN
jgi:uncharacterized membrane protein